MRKIIEYCHFWNIMVGIFAFMVLVSTFFASISFLGGCATISSTPSNPAAHPECQGQALMQDDFALQTAMIAGQIALVEFLIAHPEHRVDARKAAQQAIAVLRQDIVTLNDLVSSLQKGISSREVRQRLGYVAILGTGRIDGVALNVCDREYLLGYFKLLEGGI